MRICVVGGIFGASKEEQAKRSLTPETILVQNLRKKGIEADSVSHAAFRPSDEYDVIHVHHLGKAALRMAVANTRVPYVFTSHNPTILCGYEKSVIRKLAFRYVLARADMIVALTQTEAKFLGKLSGRQEIQVVPNGLPSDIFYPDTCPEPKEKHRILFVGQLTEFKGVDILLEAFRHVLRKWDATLLLVYQNAELESRYRQMVKGLGIANHVQFVGLLSSFELASLYRKVDMLVHPSFAEALPAVVTEAMFSGIPVVATRVGGIPDQVDKYGKLVQPGNVSELAGAIDNVLEELPKFREQAREASEYARCRFSVENMVNAHIRLYKELMDCPKKERRISRLLDKAVQFAMEVYWWRKVRRFSLLTSEKG